MKPEVLILACSPRSGSSWLMRILNKSDDIFLYPEPDDKGGKCECELSLLDRTIAKNVNSKRLREVLMTGVGRIRMMDSTMYGNRPNSKQLSFHNSKLLTEPRYVGFKTIYSPFRLGWMRKELCYPKTIWLIRNPYGHCLSRFHLGVMLRSTIRARINMSAKTLGSKNKCDEAELINIARTWRDENETAILENQDDKNFKIVVYEDLCQDPFKVVKGIFTFLGIEFDRNVAKTIGSTTLSASLKNPLLKLLSRGYFGTRKDPIDSAYRWKRLMPEKHKLSISKVVNESFLMKLFDMSFEKDN